MLLDDHASKDNDVQDPGREGSSSSEVNDQDKSPLEEHERRHSGERAKVENPWSVPTPSGSDVR